jgi:hypothetical protein
VVLIELERRRADVTYVRTPEGHEVDFLARYPDGSMELIQVCAEAETPDTAERELRALEEAGTLHVKATRRLLTVTRDTLVSRSPKGIIVQPAYEWLLCGSSKQEKRKQPRQSHTTSVSTRHWISSRLVVSHLWREVVTPHKEVASGRCRQTECAAARAASPLAHCCRNPPCLHDVIIDSFDPGAVRRGAGNHEQVSGGNGHAGLPGAPCEPTGENPRLITRRDDLQLCVQAGQLTPFLFSSSTVPQFQEDHVAQDSIPVHDEIPDTLPHILPPVVSQRLHPARGVDQDPH